MTASIWVAISAALALSVSAPARAQSPFQPVFEAASGFMLAAYACRASLGGLASYRAAQTIAVETLSQIGGRSEAQNVVASWSADIEGDPRVAEPLSGPGVDQACQAETSEALRTLEDAKRVAGLQ